MRQLLLSGLLLCMTVGCSSTNSFTTKFRPAKKASVEMQFEMARACEADGQFARAETAYQSLCEAHPKVARYHQRRGVVLTKLGQPQQGLVELEQASQLDPDNTNILNDLGYTYLKCGEPTKAAEYFRKTLDLDPQNQRANNNLALAMGYDGDLKESFRIYQNTMPEAEALTNLGYLAVQNGRTDLAVKAYSRALTLEPDKKSAAEGLTQLALMGQDIEQTRSIANDLNSETNNSTEIPEEIPLNPKSTKKSTKVSVNRPVSNSHPASITTSAVDTSSNLLLSDFDE